MSDVRIVSSTPCPCCGAGGAECRTKAGGAELIGVAGFQYAPGAVPNYFLAKTASGQWTVCIECAGCGSSTETQSYRQEWSGSYITNAVTGEITNTLLRKFGGSQDEGCEPPPMEDYPYFEFACGEEDGTVTCSETSKNWNSSSGGSGACRESPPCGTSTIIAAVTWSLSNMDTLANAIARFLAATPWSAWVAGGGCIAAWQNRTEETGPSFDYAEVEWRVARTGLVPSTNYRVNVPIMRRVYGTGAYVLFQTVTGIVATSPTGAFSVTGTVPNAQGYQTYAASPTVIKL